MGYISKKFLKDKTGNIKSNDSIFEVGPGTGNLTEKILQKKPLNVTVIEKDDKLANLLNKKFEITRLKN